MKIHSILLCKNEVDVIEECLREASRWSARIHVYDGASTDGTWERVQAMADDHIVPWRSDAAVFREGLRAEVFAAFRHEAKEGDWWCQLNGDEFYVRDPHAFLLNVPKRDHVVWGVNVQYYLTDADMQRGDITGDFAQDRPRIRYYKAACAEPRFFRHRDRLQWRTTDAWPQHVGVVHHEPLYFRHYPYRSPQQIQTRLDVRRDNRARGFEGWDHAKELDWQEKIVPASTMHYDTQDGQLIVEADVLRQHLEPPARRLIKRLFHGVGIWP